ncbi:hypothetical protein Tco_1205217 [Tanacetum coccineum]
MAYSDKYKKILDEICVDKMKLDGEMKKEEEEAIIKVKGEALIEKEDPRVFVILIRLEAKIDLNALADTNSDINVGATTIIAKFLILDKPIDIDTPILVGRGFLYTCGSILNTIERITSTFDGIFHQMFRVAKTRLNTVKSDSDDEEDYGIQRNSFGALHKDWKPKYTGNYCKKEEGDGQWHTMRTHDDEEGSLRSKRSRQYEMVEEAMLLRVHHPFLLWEGCSQAAKSRYNTRLAQLLPRYIYSPCVVDWNVLNHMSCGEVIDEMLTIKLCVAGTDEEIFTSEAWTTFNIEEPIYSELCHEFYSTYEFNEVCVDDELRTKKIIRFRLCGRAFSWTFLEFAKRLGLYRSEEIAEEGFDVYFQGGLRSHEHFNAREYWLSISREDNLSLSRSLASTIRNPVLMIARWMKRKGAGSQKKSMIYCGRFITKIAYRKNLLSKEASMRDLYERMGSMEIRQGAIERMAYMQSYHWDRYHGVFKNMAGVYDVSLQGAYNLPGYDQQLYEQYYQQHLPQQQQQQPDDDE